MNEIDRINLCLKIEEIPLKTVIEKTGIERSRLSRMLSKKLRLSSNELIAIANIFTEYKHWIVFGEELTESNQISPITKMNNQFNNKEN